MNKLFFFAAVAVALGGVVRGQEPVNVYWNDTETRVYQAGHQNIELTCILNRDYQYLLERKVDICFRGLQNGSEDVHLFSDAKRDSAADPEFYDISYGEVDGGTRFSFKILTLRLQDDGLFVCKTGDIESTVEMVVLEPLSEVNLQLDDLPPITEKLEEALVLEPGEHVVRCTAGGSNPKPKDVSIFIAGDEISSSEIDYQEMASSSRRYSASTEAVVSIGYGAHHGKTIVCQGVGPDDVRVAVSVPVRVNAPPVDITCTDASADPGDKMVVLTCMVNHTDVSVDYFKYKITHGDDVMVIPDDPAQTADGKEVKILPKSPESEVTEVQLIFHEVELKDFDSSIHLVVESAGGKLDEERVKLVSKEEKPRVTSKPDSSKGADGNSSPMLNASLVTVLVFFLLAKLF